jgi:hypothetical protein
MRLQPPQRMQKKAAMEADSGCETAICGRIAIWHIAETGIFHQIIVSPSARNSARFLTRW